MKKSTTAFFFCLFLFALAFSPSLVTSEEHKKVSKGGVIPDQYIVVLKDSESVDAVLSDLKKKHEFDIDHVYKKALKGFSAKLSSEKLGKVKSDPRVLFISEDREVEYLVKDPPSEEVVKGNAKRPRPTPTPPPQTIPFGVSRIGLNATNEGAGIGVAVIDTGVNLTHPDLQTNIVANTTCITGSSNGNDDNGHGSHVAGTIAALNNTTGVLGIAPQAKLAAVKVLNAQGSGTWSSVICGVDWVTTNAGTYNIKVANMSLGGGGSSDNNCGKTNNDALHKAICNSRDAGITYVVAAGNSNTNSSSTVPAAYNDAVITVSALADSNGQAGGTGPATTYGADDTFATFSNYGSVVDLGAPGVSINSTYKNGGYATMNGTSMASPHVAGAAALYIKTHPGSSWSQVRDGLINVAELLGYGHTDPSGLHLEPVVKANTL